MRSTVRIDDDLMTALRARAQAEGLSLTRMLNRLLRAGLAASLRSSEERERYEEETVRMGRPRFDLDKALGARGRSRRRGDHPQDGVCRKPNMRCPTD